jgi:hypothetical protein
MYCIAGFQKVKENQEFSQMANHNYRIHLTQAEVKRIDSSRTHLNKILINPLGVDTKIAGDLSKKINEYYKKIEAKVKENSVLAVDLMLTTSPEFFQNNGETWHKNGKIKPEFQKKLDDWVAVQIEFVKKEFGESAIKSAVLHLDETTPHIHFLITPEQTKELKYKNQYGTQNKISTSLNADRWNPNFWKKFLTNYEKVNKKFGLKKGEEGSMSENISLKEFSKMVSKASKTDYSNAIEKIVNSVENDLSVLNTKDGVKKLLLEKLLPALNPMLKQNKALKKVLALDRAKEYSAIKKMKADLEKALIDNQEKRELFAEAINEKTVKDKVIIEQESEIQKLKVENSRLKEKYEPQKIQYKNPSNIPPKIK